MSGVNRVRNGSATAGTSGDAGDDEVRRAFSAERVGESGEEGPNNNDPARVERLFRIIEKYCFFAATKEEREVIWKMAQFIVLQDFDGKYRDNCHLHREIIQFIFEFPAILQNQSLETFIKVGEEFSAAFRLEADQETTSMETKVKMMSDLKAVHSAINCLAACKKFGTVELFAKICEPSTESAKTLRAKYTALSFGKEAVVARILGGANGYDKSERTISSEAEFPDRFSRSRTNCASACANGVEDWQCKLM